MKLWADLLTLPLFLKGMALFGLKENIILNRNVILTFSQIIFENVMKGVCMMIKHDSKSKKDQYCRTFEEYEERFHLQPNEDSIFSTDDPFEIGSSLALQSLKEFKETLLAKDN